MPATWRSRSPLQRLWWLLAVCLLAVSIESTHAAAEDQIPPVALEIFPRATGIGSLDPELPIRPVYQLRELIGYVFETDDLTELPGFSGETINLLVGIDTKGQFAGVEVLRHHEPIFLHGLGEAPLWAFVGQYRNRSVADRIIVDRRRAADADHSEEGPVFFDGVTKATVSVMVVNDTVTSAALAVARQKLDDFAQPAPARAREDVYQTLGWQALLDNGYVRHWRLPAKDAEESLGRSLSDYPDQDFSNSEVFVELFYGYLNPPTIGRNILGDSDYQRLLEELRPGEHAFLVMSRGAYSHVEPGFRPATVPGRLAITQRGLPMEIRDLDFYGYYPLALTSDAPDVDQLHVFRIKAQAGFDPSASLDLALEVRLQRNPLIQDASTFTDRYQLPVELFEQVKENTEPARQAPRVRIWHMRLFEVAVLVVALMVLTIVFVRQDTFSRHPVALHRFRWAYLWFTLLFVGFYAQGQLSVVNIYTLLLGFRDGFDIRVFLLDPVIFVLWLFTFVSLFLWGRGLFCGWLCPFGAMQEMVSWLAKRLRIRQWRIPEHWHRSLLWVKYPLLGGLVLVSLYSLTWAERLAEVEPFKTAVTLAFQRYWPFVLYAVALLVIGLFVHKFYCRYLCPLGAGLAVIGRLRWFEWLQRRQECGSPCQLCRHRCEIGAIRRSGAIDYDECVQCLECLVIINNPTQCAPARVGLKREQRTITIAPAPGPLY
jgi:NosR/NirI family nitrous oxide reductase transcriptional regulator